MTFAGLFVAVLAVSWASIFVRWCGDTPALVIAFYRMLWSIPLFLLLTLQVRRKNKTAAPLSKKEIGLIFAAGLFLALHFATWIASLQFTMIAHSLTLTATHPVFALLLGPIFLGEKSSWRGVLAVSITLAGIVIIGGQDFSFHSRQFFGNLLAISSALFFTFYIFIGRYMRGKVALIIYLLLVYGSAAIVLFIFNLASDYPLLDYPLAVHVFMLLLALIPTGIGHSLINWAARRTEVYKVNISILGEPLLSSILGYFIFAEAPYGWFYVGAACILSGITVALSDKKRS